MANLSGFDASKVKPNEALAPLPAGDYPVVIIGSEMKDTRDGNGKFLELKLQVASGKHQNRKLFDRLNLVNANEKAVIIAQGTLSAICRAVNVLTPNDSSELHNRKLLATVKVKPDQNGNPRNEISGYKPFTNMIEEAFQEPAAVAGNKSPF